MKIIHFALFFCIIFACCSDKQTKETVVEKEIKNEKTIKERLHSYFFYGDETPAIIFNNVNIRYDQNPNEVAFLNHKIQWIESEEEDIGSKIKIDDDLFTLKGKKTLNNVEGTTKNDVDFANNWRQIRYYNYNQQELICIEMVSYPCTGIGCGVNYYLLYDIKHKTKNYFGTYRIDDYELQLFNFNNDDKGQLDFVSKTNLNHDKTIVFELFSLGKDGIFRIQKNSKGQKYELKHTVVENSTGAKETLSENWFEPIN